MLRATASFVLFALLAPLALARTRTTLPVDPDYVYALATANNFLHAWQTQDQETAILLLSDHLKQSTPDSALDRHLNSSAKPQSFEIGHGRKLAPGRYRFPVALFQSPAKTKWMRPQTAALLVIKTGNNEWVIDKLP